MDWNRLITMLTQMFIRTAVDKGIEYAARRGKPEAEMTPAERQQAEAAKRFGEKAKDVAKVGRRIL